MCRNHWTKNHLLLLLLSFFVFDFVDFSAQNQPQQEWNGIVRELLDRKADIAVAPMTINFARFVTLKYNVLYRKVVESILFFNNFLRVEICQDRCDQKLCKIFASCVDFPENYAFSCKVLVAVQDLHLPSVILH